MRRRQSPGVFTKFRQSTKSPKPPMIGWCVPWLRFDALCKFKRFVSVHRISLDIATISVNYRMFQNWPETKGMHRIDGLRSATSHWNLSWVIWLYVCLRTEMQTHHGSNYQFLFWEIGPSRRQMKTCRGMRERKDPFSTFSNDKKKNAFECRRLCYNRIGHMAWWWLRDIHMCASKQEENTQTPHTCTEINRFWEWKY